MSSTDPIPAHGLSPAAPSATPQPGVALLRTADRAVPSLADRLDALLPQTQCTRCGYPDCRAYAEALAAGEAELDQCPPGGAEGVERLARALGRPARPLNPAHGDEGPRRLVFIDEAACIGCTLCIQACPVDAIIGAPKRMHAVVEPLCTGCERCIPACPVDCIEREDASGSATGWAAWSSAQADAARTRYAQRRVRLERDEREHAQRLADKLAARQAHAARAAAPSTAAGAGDGCGAAEGSASPASRAADAGPIVRPKATATATATTTTTTTTTMVQAIVPAVVPAIAPEGTPDRMTAADAAAAPPDPKRAAIEAALARARLRATMRPS